MKVNFTRESCLSTANELDYDKDYLKEMERICNERLRTRGFLFLNDVLDSIGVRRLKRGQLDGWLWSDIEQTEQNPIKFKIKVSNGEIILNLNEERDIIDTAFNN